MTSAITRATKLGSSRLNGSDLGLVGIGAAVAILVGYMSTEGRPAMGLALVLVPIAVWLVDRPSLVLVGLGASIPALMSVMGNASSLHIAVSDLLLVAVGAILLLDRSASLDAVLGSLRPLAWPLVPYCAAVGVLLAAHLSTQAVAQTAQRYELFVLPLAAGAYACFKGRSIRILQAYIVATSLLALVWHFHNFGLQKNPVGQMMTNAILLLASVRELRRLTPCLIILVPGLLLTESRGALGALAIGLAIVVVRSGIQMRSVLLRLVPIVLVAVGAFALVPSSVRARVTTLSAGTNTPAAYSIHIRHELSADARGIIGSHPWLGVGVGDYARADAASATPSDDPHDVVLLEAAEGGYLFAGAWIVLIIGSGIALLRMRQNNLSLAAAAVLFATAAHGLVDVYWVRGTPVLGWLLAGMACAMGARQRISPS